MDAWWTYRLSDFLLFSPATYRRLFELYNAAVWPLHVAAVALGLAAAWSMLRRKGRTVAVLLAACWLWVAWGWFLGHYAAINWAADYAAAAFAAQAGLLFVLGTLGERLTFARPRPLGLALFAVALVVQPLLGMLPGRDWRGAELFGLAPDPTVVATLGVLAAARRMRWGLLAIPLLWCAVGGATLWAMDAPEAALMPAAGALAVGAGIREAMGRRS